MGQYHRIYNVTKKEYITASQFNEGVKLLEFGSGGLTTQALCVLLCNSNGRGGGDLNIYGSQFEKRDELKYYIDAVAGRWSGDKIVIQGDYAEKNDPSYLSPSRLKNFTDISERCIEALMVDDSNREEALAPQVYCNEGNVRKIASMIQKQVKDIDARLKKEKKAAGAK